MASPIWWWSRKAERVGARPGAKADVELPDGTTVAGVQTITSSPAVGPWVVLLAVALIALYALTQLPGDVRSERDHNSMREESRRLREARVARLREEAHE